MAPDKPKEESESLPLPAPPPLQICTACGAELDFKPTPGEVRLPGFDMTIRGVMIATCKCGTARMKFPEMPEEQAAKVRQLLAEGRTTSLSIGYNSDDVNLRFGSRSRGARRPPRKGMGDRVLPAFRPRTRKG